MPSLWNLLPIVPLAALPNPGLYCYMINPAGQVIDLAQVCGIAEVQQTGTAPASPAPVVGGNDLIPAVLDIQQDGQAWVLSGQVGNRGPEGITVRAVIFDVLDGAGQVIYQGSIQPIPELSRVQAGTQQRVSTRIPGSQISGKPESVVVQEVRYVR